jgi:adenylate cyclase
MANASWIARSTRFGKAQQSPMSQPSPISSRSLYLVPLVCFGLAFLLSLTGFVTQLEWRSLDLRTALRVKVQRPPDPRIAVVIYDDSTNEVDPELPGLAPWPPDRRWHANFLKLLFVAEPAVIAWDVIFDADGKSPEGDQDLADSAQMVCDGGVPVISAGVSSSDDSALPPPHEGPTRPFRNITGNIQRLRVGEERAYFPYEALRKSSFYSFADTPQEADGIRRKVPLLVRVGKEVYPSLGLQSVLLYLQVKPEDVLITLGKNISFSAKGRDWKIPIDVNGCFWVNFRYDKLPEGAKGNEGIQLAPYCGVIKLLHAKFVEGKNVAPPDLKGKIVFIGQTVTGMADAGPTPLSSYSSLTLYHANVADSILQNDYVHELPAWLVWLGTIAGTLLLFRYYLRRNASWLIALCIGILLLHACLCTALWLYWSVWLPWLGPSMGFAGTGFTFVALRFRQEQRAKEKIKGMFGSYLSPDLLAKISKEGSTLQVKSERRPVTILFSDLRNFTAWSESTSEEILISQLNEYLTAMVECIHAEGGTLHKFIGDAIMAVWGDLQSVSPEEDARHACQSALAMQDKLAELNTAWNAKNMHTLEMGIGINQGTVLVGNIGSPRRMEFTVIGDAVNLASRLESLNKELKTRILVGESVQQLVGQHFVFVAHGPVHVKGKAQLVDVFELRESFTH